MNRLINMFKRDLKHETDKKKMYAHSKKYFRGKRETDKLIISLKKNRNFQF